MSGSDTRGDDLTGSSPESSTAQYEATIALATHNRRADLLRALRSAVAQEGRVEVIVVDDASSDGTADMVASEFPAVRLVRLTQRVGVAVARNLAAREAAGPIIISIDDDAEFTDPRTVAQTVRDFDDPRIGAVAIPYVDAPHPNEDQQRAPAPHGRWISATFRGTAVGIRRDVFLAVGGYRETVFHQGEEPDFSLRMLAAGFVVRLGRAAPVHHHQSPKRNLSLMAIYGRRNEQIYSFIYYPFPLSILMMLGYALKGMRLGLALGNPRAMARGIALGLRSCWVLRSSRRPLPLRVLILDRRLRMRRSTPIEEVVDRLPSAAIGSAEARPRTRAPDHPRLVGQRDQVR